MSFVGHTLFFSSPAPFLLAPVPLQWLSFSKCLSPLLVSCSFAPSRTKSKPTSYEEAGPVVLVCPELPLCMLIEEFFTCTPPVFQRTSASFPYAHYLAPALIPSPPVSHSHILGFFLSVFFLSAYKFAQSSLILKYPSDATSFLVPILCVLSFKLECLEE